MDSYRQGMTLKDLLEDPNLLNPPSGDSKGEHLEGKVSGCVVLLEVRLVLCNVTDAHFPIQAPGLAAAGKCLDYALSTDDSDNLHLLSHALRLSATYHNCRISLIACVPRRFFFFLFSTMHAGLHVEAIDLGL